MEYVLLRDVNDSREQARLLAEFLKPLHAVTRCRTNPQRKRTGLLVNLIPFNEGGGGTAGGGGGAREEGEDGPWAFKRPASERVQEFQAELRRRGVWASVRVQRGDDQSAACGMLATGRQPLPPGQMPL